MYDHLMYDHLSPYLIAMIVVEMDQNNGTAACEDIGKEALEALIGNCGIVEAARMIVKAADHLCPPK